MLCGYDAWKLAYPRWWDDEPELCEECDQEIDECTCNKEEEQCQNSRLKQT